MANTAYDILRLFQIQTKHTRPGQQKTTCPRCSSGRRNRKEPCLSLKIDEKGVVWDCHHCGWKDARYYEPSGGAHTPKSGGMPVRSYSKLHAGAAASWVPQRA